MDGLGAMLFGYVMMLVLFSAATWMYNQFLGWVAPEAKKIDVWVVLGYLAVIGIVAILRILIFGTH